MKRRVEEKKHISRPFFAALNLFAINSRQAGPDAPHEAESAAPWSLFKRDHVISLYPTILRTFSVLRMPSMEKGRGWDCRRRSLKG